MDIQLVAGLGNPGYDYRGSYHNVGYQSIDRLLRAFDYTERSTRPGTLYDLDAAPVPLAGKPDCYVNQSGGLIKAWSEQLDLPPESILVIYDDFSIDVGEVRVRPGGSAGGHNGVSSIIEELGSRDFPRLRIGIGPVPDGGDTADFVLSPIREDEQPVFDRIFDTLPEILDVIDEDGLDRAMNTWNGKDFSTGS